MGLNFVKARIELSVKSKLKIPIFGSKIYSNFNVRNKITKNIAVLLIPTFVHGKNLHALYFSKFGVESLK